jgi:5-methylcytosine-specific restriction endonuclease McrA
MSKQNRKVLVLNKNWNPVGIVKIQRAITLLFSIHNITNLPKAKIIDTKDFSTYYWEEWAELNPEDYDELDIITTPKNKFRVPEIIFLTKYNKIPKNKVAFSKKALFKRDNFQCQFCGTTKQKLTVDHILPRSQGGKTCWQNCCTSCEKCNTKKSDKTLKQAGMNFYFEDFLPARPKCNFFKSDMNICENWKLFLEPILIG